MSELGWKLQKRELHTSEVVISTCVMIKLIVSASSGKVSPSAIQSYLVWKS